jgi:hypothetical protein
MKRLFVMILSVLVLTVAPSFSQPYVPNPSFDLEDAAHPYVQVLSGRDWKEFQRCAGVATGDFNHFQFGDPGANCTEWYTPTLGSPDLFQVYTPGHAGVYDEVKIPGTFFGTQYAVDNGHGFAGIYSNREIIRGHLVQTREYMQAILINPLLRGHKYHVSFKVSLADTGVIYSHSVPKPRLCGTNKMGAYLSSDPPHNTSGKENTQPLYGISPQVIHNDQPGGWLSNTGGTSQTEWMTVADDIVVPDDQDYQYITIGNFSPFLTSQNVLPAPIAGDEIFMYYFIDDIQITDLNPEICECGESVYTVTITPNQNQNLESSCCFDFNIAFSNSTLACNVFGVRIFKTSDMSTALFTEQNTTAYPKGSSVDFTNICLSKSSGPEVSFTIQYLDQNGNVICSVDKTSMCNCNCSEALSMTELVNIKIESSGASDDTTKCCYKVVLSNNSDCFYKIKSVFLEAGKSIKANISLPPANSDWSGYAINEGGSSLDRIWKWTNSSSDYVKPHSTVNLGEFCIPADGQDYPVALVCNPGTDTNVFCSGLSTYQTLKCMPPAQVIDCCDNIHAELANQNSGVSHEMPLINNCCWYLYISQENSPNCDVYSVWVYNYQNGNLDIIQNNMGGHNYPISFGKDGKLFDEYCIEQYSQGTNTLTLHLDFFDEGGVLMCSKDVSASCTGGSAMGSPGMKAINIENESNNFILSADQSDESLFVTPSVTNNLINIHFKAKDKESSKIYISDNLGNVIHSLDLSGFKSSSLQFNFEEFSGGMYYVQLSTQKGIITKKVAVVK